MSPDVLVGELLHQDGQALGIHTPEAMVRYLLHLTDTNYEDLGEGDLRRLVNSAVRVRRAGRTCTAQELRAFHAERALLDHDSSSTDYDGNPGRDWGSAGIPRRLLTSNVITPAFRYPRNPAADTSQRAPWHQPGMRPYSVQALYDPASRTVMAWDRVSSRWLGLSHEEFARLVAADPTLSGATGIVLAGSHMGDVDLDLPRTVARQTGHDVWAYTEELSFTSPRGLDILVMRPHENERETRSPGVWVRCRPDNLDVADASRTPQPGAVTYRSYPLVDRSGNPYGRAFFDDEMRAVLEASEMRFLPETTQYRLGYPENLTADDEWIASDRTRTLPYPWPGDLPPSYWLDLHGEQRSPQRYFLLPANDGTNVELTPGQLNGDVLRHRKSFNRPRPAAEPGRPAPRRTMVLTACRSGELPGGADPLWHSSLAQQLADAVGDLYDAVYAPNGDLYTVWAEDGAGGMDQDRILMVMGGDSARLVEFRPSPTAARLAELAAGIGMRWPGAEPPSDHWREDTLMGLVRFLRHVFTAAVEDRADYQFLLEGAWALERMRLNDPTQREQLLSFRALEEVRESARATWGLSASTDRNAVARDYWHLLHDARNPYQRDLTLPEYVALVGLVPSTAPRPHPPLPTDHITTVLSSGSSQSVAKRALSAQPRPVR
ncbi:lonely Cys domain-containing protein [Streptomyces sp. NBC_01549]|uniref:lonely Cys domain-containing protein n=1 Tax=Streptomyces sp. NBC_01549 TaxID=2975874 RepID=UPI002259D14D|nr:lonely Cys domain-containing protein [Streptomyces sp. NBC_01549]MCX4597484.1 lonely Cys domain-containing protein [Streptomyces sp. NBC_01549]